MSFGSHFSLYKLVFLQCPSKFLLFFLIWRRGCVPKSLDNFFPFTVSVCQSAWQKMLALAVRLASPRSTDVSICEGICSFFAEIAYSLALLLFEVFLQAPRTTRTDVGSSPLKLISARKGDTGRCRTWLEVCLYLSCFHLLWLYSTSQWKHIFPSVGQMVLGLLQSSMFTDYWR